MLRIKPSTAILSLIILTVAVFMGTMFAHFVLWDDNIHIFQNPYLQPVTLKNTLHFWLHPYENLYIPVSYTFYALLTLLAIRPPEDAGPFAGPQLTPSVFHIANLVLHVLNVMLVFLILRALTKRNLASAAGAALFAIHPLQVESVAWISELRGLLCGAFTLSSIYAYITYSRWTRAGDTEGRATRSYIIAIVTMVLAMLSKPSAAPLPLVFFVIDHWAYGRPWKVAAKMSLPWLLALAPFILITQGVQPTGTYFKVPFWQRPFVAGDALAFYLAKLVAPIKMVTDYGRRPDTVMKTGVPYWDWIVPVVGAAAIYSVRRVSRTYVVGGLIALAFLLPVLGFTTFIYQRFSTVADRYCYLPMLGVALIVATILAIRPSNIKWAIAACALLIFAGVSHVQAKYWNSTIALLGHTVSINPNSAASWANLGGAYASNAKDSSAHHHSPQEIADLNNKALNAMFTSLKLDGSNDVVVRSIGDIYMFENNYPLAEKYYYKSLSMRANQADIRANLGQIYYAQGNEDRALAEYSAALNMNPKDWKVRVDLASILLNKKRFTAAALVIAPVVENFPDYQVAHKTLGIALFRIGMVPKAEGEFKLAVNLKKTDPESRLLHAVALLQQNKMPEAQSEIQQAHALFADQKSFNDEVKGVLAVLNVKVRPQPPAKPK